MSIQYYAFMLLIIAISTDAFAAGLSYGFDRVRIPFLSNLLISLLSGIFLLFSFWIGSFLQALIPGTVMKLLSFGILFLLGVSKLYDLYLKKAIKSANKEDFSILSPKEALFLGTALSIDNIAAGVGSSFANFSSPYTFGITVIMNLAAIRLGCLTGEKVSKHLPFDFAWAGAALLFLLAFLRLFQ